MDLNLDLTPWQIEFLNSPCTVKALSGASDTGKSWICRLHLILACLNNPRAHMFSTASTHTQTYRAICEPIIDFLESNKIQYLAKLKKGDGYIEFFNKSRIEIFSSDNMNQRLRSREFSMGFIEEASTIPDQYIEKIYYESIRRLRQPGQKYNLLLATNPDLKTRWLYKNVFEVPPEDTYVKMLCFKDGFNKDDKVREDKILMGSKREVDLFYNGLWGNVEGQAFILQPGTHIAPVPTELPKYYLSFDYGFFPDPMVYLLMGVEGSKVYVVDEIVMNSVPVSRHADLLKPWTSKYNIVGFTGETATGSGEIRDVLINQFKLKYYPTTKKRSEGWTKLADYLDQERLVIDPKCKNTIESLGSQVWISGTVGVDVQGIMDDCADAVRYFLMSQLVGKPEVNRLTNVKVSNVTRAPQGRFLENGNNSRFH